MSDSSRARSFGPVAIDYHRHRPGYPDAAVEWALGGIRGTVLDLGAGTGKLTGALLSRAERVIAVEPDPAMLSVLRDALPSVTALAGSAEAIPLPDGSADAVVVGQALHWFDEDRAGPEIARVLRPGGTLAGLWNADDDRVDWVRGLREVTAQRWAPIDRGDGRPKPPRYTGFEPGERADFRHARWLTADGLIATLATESWALVSGAEERAAVFERVRSYLADRPELGETFELPLRTIAVRMLRR